ncbi:GSCOCG00003784001-RA-CDS [Cotesia congregata]|nr:GSCOCG00003784001-RA-CDS [Cotesia congregata]
MVMRIAPWSNDPLWILHYTLHVTFLSPSVFHNRYTCISFTLVYTATTVQPFHPWSVRKRRCRRPLSFGRTSGSRLLHSQLTLFTVYYRLEEPKKKKKHTKQK